MKKIYSFKITVFTLLFSITLGACGKLELLKDIDTESIPAGANLKNKTIWEFVSDSTDKETQPEKGLGLYAKAIERVGLKELLNTAGDYTVVVANNEAMLALAARLGYANNVDGIPAILLRNMFLANITATRVRSFELPENEFLRYETLNNDSISFVRTTNAADSYIVTINSSPTFSSIPTLIRTQNLECKNGIVHVVDILSNYAPKISPKNIPPAKISDTIFVSKDSYMNNGSTANKNRNYGLLDYMWIKKAAADFTRRAITQFPVRQATFPDNIGNVRIALYANRADGNGGIVSIYEDANVDFGETTINWSNAPTPGGAPLGNINLTADSLEKYHSVDVTSAYLAALNSNKTFINFGINTADVDLFAFASKQATVNALGVPGSYIPLLILSPAQITVLTNPTNTGIIVDSKVGIKRINTKELKFEGTTSNNISFTVINVPTNGFLTVNGIAAMAGSTTFTQEQIEKGSVKYLYTGTGAGTDSFTVKGKDAAGSPFATDLTVNITIQ